MTGTSRWRAAGAKGQLSFDMAFAVIFLMALIGVIVHYFAHSEAAVTVMDGRRLMALNVVADSSAGSLRKMYSMLAVSRVAEGPNASYVLEFPESYLFEEADGSKYELGYTAWFGPGSLAFADSSRPTLIVSRQVPGISCIAGQLPQQPLPIIPGQSLTLWGCRIDESLPDDPLLCKECELT